MGRISKFRLSQRRNLGLVRIDKDKKLQRVYFDEGTGRWRTQGGNKPQSTAGGNGGGGGGQITAFPKTERKLEQVCGQDVNNSSSSSMFLQAKTIDKEKGSDLGRLGVKVAKGSFHGHHFSHLKYAKTGIENGDEGFSCGRCGAHFNKAKDLSFHNQFEGDCSKNREMYPCPICGFKFVTQLRLDHHIRLNHPEERGQGLSLTCPKCSRNFLEMSEVVQHLRLHGQYTCPVQDCWGEFKSKNSFEAHMRSHHRPPLPKPFPCQICPLRFTTQESLEVHEAWSHKKGVEDETLSCKYCLKTFSQYPDLVRHEEWHIQKPQYPPKFYLCCTCEKKFANERTLKSHIDKCHRHVGAGEGSSQSSTKITRYKEAFMADTSTSMVAGTPPSIISGPEGCPTCSDGEDCKCGLVLDIDDVKIELDEACDFLEFTSNTDESKERSNQEEGNATIPGWRLLPLDQDLEEFDGHINTEEGEDPLQFL